MTGAPIVCTVGRYQEPLSWHTVTCYLLPLSGATVTTHGAQCCALSLIDGDSVIAAYWEVFLYHRPPAGAAVAAHSVMMSRQAAVVSTVDVVKVLVI